YFMLSVDQVIVNSHIIIFSDAVKLMFVSYYCLNISYPAEQGATLEFVQSFMAGNQDPNADEFEDKDWTFIIENTKGHRKVLASVDVNMKQYASATPAQLELALKLKPLSVKVVDVTLKLTLSCVFLKEGNAT
ncbi:putative EH domain-binding protein 1-like protein 1, partial [Triplophysa rosa]